MKLNKQEKAIIINALKNYQIGFVYQSKRLEIEKLLNKFQKSLLNDDAIYGFEIDINKIKV